MKTYCEQPKQEVHVQLDEGDFMTRPRPDRTSMRPPLPSARVLIADKLVKRNPLPLPCQVALARIQVRLGCNKASQQFLRAPKMAIDAVDFHTVTSGPYCHGRGRGFESRHYRHSVCVFHVADTRESRRSCRPFTHLRSGDPVLCGLDALMPQAAWDLLWGTPPARRTKMIVTAIFRQPSSPHPRLSTTSRLWSGL